MIQPTTKEAYALFHEGSLTLADMERHGIHVDVPRLRGNIQEVVNQITNNQRELRNDKVWSDWRRVF